MYTSAILVYSEKIQGMQKLVLKMQDKSLYASLSISHGDTVC